MSTVIDRLAKLENKLDVFSNDLQVLQTLHDIEDPQAQLNKIRYISEGVLHMLCTKHDVSWGKAEPTLERMIGPLRAAKILPAPIASHLRSIQSTTSPGSHYQKDRLNDTHSHIALLALVEVLDWYIQTNGEILSKSGSEDPKTQSKSRKPLLMATIVFAILLGAVGLLYDATPANHPQEQQERVNRVVKEFRENFSKRHFKMTQFVTLFQAKKGLEDTKLDKELEEYRTVLAEYNNVRGIYRLDIEDLFGRELYLWEREIHTELFYAGRNLECLINKKGDMAKIISQSQHHLQQANQSYQTFNRLVSGIMKGNVDWPIEETRTKQAMDPLLENPC